LGEKRIKRFAYLQEGACWRPVLIMSVQNRVVHVIDARGEHLSGEAEEVFATIRERYGEDCRAMKHQVRQTGATLIAFRAYTLNIADASLSQTTGGTSL